MIYGYCRCSTNMERQDIERQVMELKRLGVARENMYLEYASGVKRDRVELSRLLDIVSEGDTIVSTEVSRITRSTKQLVEIVDFASERRLKLVLGTMVVDCSQERVDPFTNAMLLICGVFSELERNIISERVHSGLINAKQKGKVLGRRKTVLSDIPSSFYKGYALYKNRDISKKELSRMTGLSYPTIFKYIKIINDERNS